MHGRLSSSPSWLSANFGRAQAPTAVAQEKGTVSSMMLYLLRTEHCVGVDGKWTR